MKPALTHNALISTTKAFCNQLEKTAELTFVHASFITKTKTADYQTSRGIREILERDGNRDDILAFLTDRSLPGDDIVLNNLADEILQSPPTLGYLTISNALQWRLQYGRIVNLNELVEAL